MFSRILRVFEPRRILPRRRHEVRPGKDSERINRRFENRLNHDSHFSSFLFKIALNKNPSRVSAQEAPGQENPPRRRFRPQLFLLLGALMFFNCKEKGELASFGIMQKHCGKLIIAIVDRAAKFPEAQARSLAFSETHTQGGSVLSEDRKYGKDSIFFMISEGSRYSYEGLGVDTTRHIYDVERRDAQGFIVQYSSLYTGMPTPRNEISCEWDHEGTVKRIRDNTKMRSDGSLVFRESYYSGNPEFPQEIEEAEGVHLCNMLMISATRACRRVLRGKAWGG